MFKSKLYFFRKSVIAISAFCLFSICHAQSTLSLKQPTSDNKTKKEIAEWHDALITKQVLLQGLFDKKNVITSPGFVNALILENSPYLLRHSLNPINWQPWQDDIFQQAKSQGKLIFLSIGYSTCHWCYVMEEESFIDPKIAALLSDNYIAVKVDREEMPDVDKYYTSVLQEVTGSSGWPITIVLTPAGDPLFADSYLANAQLSNLLTKLPQFWKSNKPQLQANAKKLTELINQRYEKQPVTNWHNQVLVDTTEQLKTMLDPVMGGYKGAPKFPTEAMLLFAMERLSQQYDVDLAKLVKLQLDNMFAKGLYDHVNGGFHRYSTDSRWLLPHFEKMLYNQAQMLMVYSKAYQLFADPHYLTLINDLIQFSENWLYDKQLGFYSAINAVYKQQDGAFYTWSPAQLTDILAVQGNNALIQTYSLPESNLQGLYFSDAFAPQNKSLRAKLVKQKTQLAAPDIDHKIITAWNGLMIAALVDAYTVTANPKAKKMALNTANRLWETHFNASTKQLIRSSYNASLNQIGQLSDYAYFASALLKLHSLTGQDIWLQRSVQLVEIVNAYFKASDHSFYTSDARLQSPLPRRQYFRDGELLASNALMLEVLQQLSLRTGDTNTRSKMVKMSRVLKKRFQQNPFERLYTGKVLTEIIEGATTESQYFAMGNGHIQLQYNQQACHLNPDIVLNIKLKQGWHINSASTKNKYLIPTTLSSVPALKKVNYPKDQIASVQFAKEPLYLYQGNFLITAKRQAKKRTNLRLDLQVCGSKSCLVPETIKFLLPDCLTEEQ